MNCNSHNEFQRNRKKTFYATHLFSHQQLILILAINALAFYAMYKYTAYSFFKKKQSRKSALPIYHGIAMFVLC